jgi:hypothetical protein
MFVHRVANAAAILALVLGAGAFTAIPASASKHRTRHHAHRQLRQGIPQHDGGDGDVDNNGGPSDGDGSI